MNGTNDMNEWMKTKNKITATATAHHVENEMCKSFILIKELHAKKKQEEITRKTKTITTKAMSVTVQIEKKKRAWTAEENKREREKQKLYKWKIGLVQLYARQYLPICF